jgi:ribosomal protein S18 acetylase RimI-like enzyme
MTLTAAEQSDLPEIADLVNAAYRGDSARQGWTHEADYLDGLRTDAETLRRDLEAQPDASLFILRDDASSELLGCVWLEPAADQAWYLGMLTVRPDLQDRQLGRTVLSAAEAIAGERGARRVRLTVVNVRDALIAWYIRRGYALTGEILPFPFDGRFGAALRDDLSFVVLEKTL